MVKKKRPFFKIVLEILLSISFGFLVFNLGILTLLGYLVAFFSALKNGLFYKKNNMPLKLFFGTLIIYISGKLFSIVLKRFEGGDLFGATLMALLVLYIWLSGRKLRKKG